MNCAYAACRRPAWSFRDGWPFCRGHYVLHSDENVREIVRQEPKRYTPADEAERIIRELHAEGADDRRIALVLGRTPKHVGILRRALGLRTNFVPSAPQCGTRSGHYKHKKNGEKPCEPCAQAEREYQRDHARKRRLSTGAVSRGRVPLSVDRATVTT